MCLATCQLRAGCAESSRHSALLSLHQCWSGLSQDAAAFESSRLLLSTLPPIFLSVTPIKTQWFVELDIAAVVLLWSVPCSLAGVSRRGDCITRDTDVALQLSGFFFSRLAGPRCSQPSLCDSWSFHCVMHVVLFSRRPKCRKEKTQAVAVKLEREEKA